MFDAVFLGAAMQIPSLLQLEAGCSGGALAQRIGPIRDDTIGYTLQRQSPEKVGGKLRTDIQHFHEIVAVAIVSTPFPVPLGIRSRTRRFAGGTYRKSIGPLRIAWCG